MPKARSRRLGGEVDFMDIRDVLEKGPLVGKELYTATQMEIYPLWRLCMLADDILCRRVGKRYLRFDRNIPGFARLSPAIEREFLTYTVVGLKKHSDKIEYRARELEKEIIKISREKLELSKKICKEVLEKTDTFNDSCFIIGGDVPLNMAHRDPRPERSTGEMVSGSDLDIIVVTSDELPEEKAKAIDEAMYLKKYSLLRAPVKEEVDYIIKPLSKVKQQVKFDSFDKMVACKILAEGKFIGGSRRLYKEINELIKENNIPEKLKELEAQASENRRRAEKYLLEREVISQDEYMKLFTTTEEFSEIF
jgi:hypothetical protein